MEIPQQQRIFKRIRSIDHLSATKRNTPTFSSAQNDPLLLEVSHTVRVAPQLTLYFPTGQSTSKNKLTNKYKNCHSPYHSKSITRVTKHSQRRNYAPGLSTDLSTALQDRVDLNLQYAELTIELRGLKEKHLQLAREAKVIKRLEKKLRSLKLENNRLRADSHNEKIDQAMNRLARLITTTF